MKKILAFGASNSTTSINKQLATYAAGQVADAEVTVLDLNDFEMPIYSNERAGKDGVPALANTFKDHLRNCDGVIISFAEYNGSYSSAFKNIFDWCSTIKEDMWLQKPMLLMASSPGPRGGIAILEAAVGRFPFMGGKVAAQFSLPSFGDNFSKEEGITNEALKGQFQAQLDLFVKSLG